MEAYLGRVAMFRTLPSTVHRELGRLSELRRFRKGENIFEEGEPAEFVWIVKRGCVYLVKWTPQGSLAVMFELTPDEALCGVSAFEHGTYSAGAVAATECQLIKIPVEAFSKLLERYPRFAKAILVSCCTRMRHMAEAISISRATVEQRLAYVLTRLRTSFGETIPVTHHDLARMAGTRWETSIRTLSAMRRKGWITSSRGKVTVRDPQKLRALLETPQA